MEGNGVKWQRRVARTAEDIGGRGGQRRIADGSGGQGRAAG